MQQQPSFSISQTISVSETLSWIHGKHNLRFGGDYRRVHRDFLAGSNAQGASHFRACLRRMRAGTGDGIVARRFSARLPQETTLDSSVPKSYLRDNVFDVYAQDDWRALPSLTLNYGLRYEFYRAVHREVRPSGECGDKPVGGVHRASPGDGGRYRRIQWPAA